MDDYIWIIALWIVFSLLGSLGKKNQRPPFPPQMPPDRNSEIQPDFEIPTLANDPNFPGEEPAILINDTTPQAEIREINLEEIYRQKKFDERQKFESTRKPEVGEKIESKDISEIILGLNPESSKDALILSEIFGKPKALRNR